MAMNNPLQRLKQLPWIPLLMVALLTIFWASVLELLLLLGSASVVLINRALVMLFTPPLGIIMSLAIAVGVGALAVVFLEVVYPHLMVSTGVLWALLLCLFLTMVVRNALPPQTQLLEPSYTMLIGSMLGIFMKGKPYWRY